MKTVPLLYVEWEDASSINAAWTDQQDVDHIMGERYVVAQIGWLVAETEEALCLTESLALKTGATSRLMKIPKKYILLKRKITSDRVPRMRK